MMTAAIIIIILITVIIILAIAVIVATIRIVVAIHHRAVAQVTALAHLIDLHTIDYSASSVLGLLKPLTSFLTPVSRLAFFVDTLLSYKPLNKADCIRYNQQYCFVAKKNPASMLG